MDSGLEVNRWVAVELETQERNSERGDIIGTHKRSPEWPAAQSCHIREDNSVDQGNPSQSEEGLGERCRGGDRRSCGYAMRGISEVIVTEMSEG